MNRQTGFTIIEFMIAMTLSLLVLAALTAAFVASSRSRTEVEKANEQIENGRFAVQILTDDVEMAGFLSSLDLDIAMTVETPLTAPATKPNPCATSLANLVAAMPMHIQGYDNATLDSTLDDCLADLKEDTDVLVIRRTATCVRGTANCAAINGGEPYFQSSLCEAQLGSTVAADYFRLLASGGTFDRLKRDCATRADQRQYLVHIYFIAENDQAGDGVPTLKRAELGNAADPDGFTIVPLAHGIEDLQIVYGIDNDNDGAPDAFTSDPDIYDPPGGGSGPYDECADHNAECISNWRNVMALRLNVLASNSSPTRDHVDTKIYILGQNDDGTDRCAKESGGACVAFGDGFKRHVYQTSVRLNNPAGKRES